MSLKRKNTSGDFEPSKRAKVDSRGGSNLAGGSGQQSTDRLRDPTTAASQLEGRSDSYSNGKGKGKGKGNLEIDPSRKINPTLKIAQNSAARPAARRENIRKLAPPRPFPTVPPSVSASGPKSAHKEGKNLICITRHTPLAAYLSRCKKLLVDEGYTTLHLHAMGAAIPHLLTLSISLPPILPFSREDIKVEVRTGTIEVMDEVIPEDEDEDMSLRTRGKGGVSVVIHVTDGKLPPAEMNPGTIKRHKEKDKARKVIIVREQDQEDEDMGEDGNNRN